MHVIILINIIFFEVQQIEGGDIGKFHVRILFNVYTANMVISDMLISDY